MRGGRPRAEPALALLVASVLLVVTRGGWAPWPLRLPVLTSVPGTLALNEASSAGWLTAGLAAALPPARPAAAPAGTPEPVRA